MQVEESSGRYNRIVDSSSKTLGVLLPLNLTCPWATTTRSAAAWAMCQLWGWNTAGVTQMTWRNHLTYLEIYDFLTDLLDLRSNVLMSCWGIIAHWFTEILLVPWNLNGEFTDLLVSEWSCWGWWSRSGSLGSASSPWWSRRASGSSLGPLHRSRTRTPGLVRQPSTAAA